MTNVITQDIHSLVVNGIKYLREDAVNLNNKAESLDGMPYKMLRTQSAGVFVGYLKFRNGKEATLLHARRIWYWAGAASLSQLAEHGTSPDMGTIAVKNSGSGDGSGDGDGIG